MSDIVFKILTVVFCAFMTFVLIMCIRDNIKNKRP